MEDTAAVDGADSTAFNKEEKSVRVLVGVRAGQSVRPVGYDIAEGATVLRGGETINAAEVIEIDAAQLPQPDFVSCVRTTICHVSSFVMF